MKYKILVIDDEENIRATLKDILEDAKYEVVTASDGEEGIKKATIEDIDAVLLDVMLPKKGGMEVLEYIHREFPLVAPIIMSGHGNIKMAVEAMKLGAFDFIEKPLSVERILSSVRNAIKIRELQMENINLKSRLEKPVNFIGQSPAVKAILDSLPQISQSDASVLITGENGSGKELVARLIHNYSGRKKESFVGVNCAAIPENLIESELFGYEKGAFTGAMKQKKGKFEAAHNGTIFLDEVADLSLSAQAKVLRVIQEREIERLGGNELISVNVRILAATNKDLTDEIKEGRFRQDLFYRLNVVPIHIPPLRERKEDIELLVTHFLEEAGQKTGKNLSVTKGALHLLENKKWAGNVRELSNFIERLIIFTSRPVIEAEDVLKAAVSEEGAIESKYEDMSLKEAKRDFERGLITNRLIKHNMNITKCAETLEIERTYLHKKIHELGIDNEIKMEEEN